MSDTAMSSLACKLADVMNAVGRIPKNGHNNFHNYDYATEADIVTAIRGELASRNVVLIPGITGHERHPVGEKGEVLTLLNMTFTFKDGDTAEEIERPWIGSGSDKLDKGAYKAMTGGEKYFLLKFFLVPTGDDPETDEPGTHPQAVENRQAHDARKAQQQRQPPAAAAPRDGEVFITNVKAATSGTNAKGRWTLWILKLSDEREVKTFDDAVANLATKAQQDRKPVELVLDGDKVTKLTPVFRVDRGEMESELIGR